MKTDKDNNTITFTDDNEFYAWAVDPHDVFERSENGTLYHTFNMTKLYDKAVEERTRLVIEDPNSQVVKHQAVTFRTVTIPVEVFGVDYDIKSEKK